MHPVWLLLDNTHDMLDLSKMVNDNMTNDNETAPNTYFIYLFINLLNNDHVSYVKLDAVNFKTWGNSLGWQPFSP